MKLFLFLLFTSLNLVCFSQITFDKILEGPDYESGSNICQTSDNGYIICGSKFYLSGSVYHLYLVKTDEWGDTLWTKTYGDTLCNTIGCCIQNNYDGGFIVCGFRSTDTTGQAFLLKTDENGDSLWYKTYGTLTNTFAFSVVQTTDSGFAFCGYQYGDSQPGEYAYIRRTDRFGQELWAKSYGTGNAIEWARSIDKTSDNGFIVCGSGVLDVYLLRTNSLGDSIWSKYINVTYQDAGECVRQTQDGGFIICGYTTGNYPVDSGQILLIKTDQNGDTTWTRSLGGAEPEWGYSVVQSPDNGYVVCGSAGEYGLTRTVLMKTDEYGDSLWTRYFGGQLIDEAGSCVKLTNDNGFILCGYIQDSLNADYDVHLIKTNDNGLITGIQNNNVHLNYIEIYPNPSRGAFKITNNKIDVEYEIEIRDADGDIIFQQKKNKSNPFINVSLNDCALGFYLVSVRSKYGIEYKKLLISK